MAHGVQLGRTRIRFTCWKEACRVLTMGLRNGREAFTLGPGNARSRKLDGLAEFLLRFGKEAYQEATSPPYELSIPLFMNALFKLEDELS